MIAAALVFASFQSKTLSVGPEESYASIESAVKAASPGDTIAIYPSSTNYKGAHLLIKTPNLNIKGVGPAPVKIDGTGFIYNGVGATPRAIFQFNPSADHCTLSNLELENAHNQSSNGSGVRINGANSITITHCFIHGNDMGIMSNGFGHPDTGGKDQLIDHCHIESNGTENDPGYNHNLYLMGLSVTVQNCTIDDATTGHDLKSRAHFILIQYNTIEGGMNRELDLVESEDTARPNSNAVVLGNIIEKSASSTGNHNLIHFGAENGDRNGTIYLFRNRIITPFAGPVLAMDLPDTHAIIEGNVIYNTSGRQQCNLIELLKGAKSTNVNGSDNWFSMNFDRNASIYNFKSLNNPNTTLTPFDNRLSLNTFLKPKLPTEFKYYDGNGDLKTIYYNNESSK